MPPSMKAQDTGATTKTSSVLGHLTRDIPRITNTTNSGDSRTVAGIEVAQRSGDEKRNAL